MKKNKVNNVLPGLFIFFFIGLLVTFFYSTAPKKHQYPKFKENNCIKYIDSPEFLGNTSFFKILKVGKRHYLTRRYIRNSFTFGEKETHYHWVHEEENDFFMLDESFELFNCPSQELIKQ